MDAFFEITKEQLHNIITKGVKKIRIETYPDYYDNVFKKDKLGKQLDKRLQILEQAISLPKKFDEVEFLLFVFSAVVVDTFLKPFNPFILIFAG